MNYCHMVCYPSANFNRGLECAKLWVAKGYEVLMQMDADKNISPYAGQGIITLMVPGPFPGYYQRINTLAEIAFSINADVVTCIGDDMLPPEQGAQAHAKSYFERFPNGEGVMQCTGDRQGEVIEGRVNSERICGSPTFGKVWSGLAFKGGGAFPIHYVSYYGDEELYEVAKKSNLLYQNPNFKIDHVHWAFGRMVMQDYHEKAQKNWQQDQETFFKRKAEGFPGSEIL